MVGGFLPCPDLLVDPAIGQQVGGLRELLDDEPGQTDESSLGVSYDQIDDFLEGRDIEKSAAATLIEKYRASEHKRRTPVTPTDSWWIRH